MEPPWKKRRLSKKPMPEFELEERLARSDQRLKSIFESIFEKYDRDFEGIGDEIDLESGKIIVNNGHIENMADERDAGQVFWPVDEPSSEDSSEDSDQDMTTLAGRNSFLSPGVDDRTLKPIHVHRPASGSDSPCQQSPYVAPLPVQRSNQQLEWECPSDDDDEADELAYSEQELLSLKTAWDRARDRLRPAKHRLISEDNDSIEPAWRAPPLPMKKLPQLEPFTSPRRDSSQLVRKPKFDITDKSVSDVLAMQTHTVWDAHVETSASRKTRHGGDDLLGTSPTKESIWAAEPRPRQRMRRSISSDEQEVFESPKAISDSVTKPQNWTRQEDDLLTYLKRDTTLTTKQMQVYFPTKKSTIDSHWRMMKLHDTTNTWEDRKCSPESPQCLPSKASPRPESQSLGLIADNRPTHLPTPPDALSDDDWNFQAYQNGKLQDSRFSGTLEEQPQQSISSTSSIVPENLSTEECSAGSLRHDGDCPVLATFMQTRSQAQPDPLQHRAINIPRLQGQAIRSVVRNSSSPTPSWSSDSMTDDRPENAMSNIIPVTTLNLQVLEDEKDSIPLQADKFLDLQQIEPEWPTADHHPPRERSSILPKSEDNIQVPSTFPSNWQPTSQAAASPVFAPKIKISPGPEIADSQHLRMIPNEHEADVAATASPEPLDNRDPAPIASPVSSKAAFGIATETAIAVLIPVRRPATQAPISVPTEPSLDSAVSKPVLSDLADSSDDDLSILTFETQPPRSLTKKSRRPVPVDMTDGSDDELALSSRS